MWCVSDLIRLLMCCSLLASVSLRQRVRKDAVLKTAVRVALGLTLVSGPDLSAVSLAC